MTRLTSQNPVERSQAQTARDTNWRVRERHFALRNVLGLRVCAPRGEAYLLSLREDPAV